VQRAITFKIYGRDAVTGKGDSIWFETYKGDDGKLQKVQRNAAYEYRVGSIEVSSTPSGGAKIQLDNFGFKFGRAVVNSNLEVGDGEKLVVGTSSWENTAMILVLTAKIIK
jgi:hypothetical protein